MAIYSIKWNSTKYDMRLAELPLYGADRLGEYKPNMLVTPCSTCANVTTITNVANSTIRTDVNTGSNYKVPLTYTYTTGKMSRRLGLKEYEIKNHLGNVLTTISDRKLAFKVPGNSTVNIDYYLPMVMSHADYYPYGMPINSEERTGIAASGTGYRYGFGGQEKDNEIYGAGNAYSAEYWEYDSRLGRRWNIDPVVNVSISGYATFNNNPIYFTDPSGANPGGGDDETKGEIYKDPEATGGSGYRIFAKRPEWLPDNFDQRHAEYFRDRMAYYNQDNFQRALGINDEFRKSTWQNTRRDLSYLYLKKYVDDKVGWTSILLPFTLVDGILV